VSRFDLDDPYLRRRLSLATVVVCVVALVVLTVATQVRHDGRTIASGVTPPTPSLVLDPRDGVSTTELSDGVPTTFGLITSTPFTEPTTTPTTSPDQSPLCESAALALRAAVATGRAGRLGAGDQLKVNARIYVAAMREMAPRLTGQSEEQAILIVARVSRALAQLDSSEGPADPRQFYAEVERDNLASSSSLFGSLAALCPGLRSI